MKVKSLENNTYCSMIEDLLPLYIENLVNEQTKEEIEKHLKECEKCKKALEEIKTKNIFDLEEKEEENQKTNRENIEKEIKCIKHIKRKIFLKTLLAIIITIVVVLLGVNIWNTYRIMKDENGKWILYNMNTGNIKEGIDATNVYAEYTLINNGIETTNYVLLTFDKDDKCINARRIVSGYNEEEIQKEYNNIITNWKLLYSNVKIENGKLYMNDNAYTGKSKEKLLKNLKEDYNAKVIEI